MPRFISKNQEDTFNIARVFAAKFRGGEVLALYGQLGAGKTTFVKGAINYFLPGKRILSPTFIIVRHYYPAHPFLNHLLHVDLYRLQNSFQISALGLSEFFNSAKTVVFIEWADRMKHLLPEKRTDLYFKIKTENTREIIF